MTTPSHPTDSNPHPNMGEGADSGPHQPNYSSTSHTERPHEHEGDGHADISISDVVKRYTQTASEVLTLAELESRVAVQATIRSFGLMCAISVLGVSAWITLIASLSVWVWQAGVSLPVVLFLGCVVFSASAWGLLVALKVTAQKISLKNTIEVVTGKSL
jgi:hypothetical protein